MFPSTMKSGVIWGIACGDALLAPYEGGPIERLLWKLIGKNDARQRYTDDTQMNIDILSEYLEAGELDQDKLALRFANSYKWSRGYGPDAARTLKGVKKGGDWRILNKLKFKDGSYGNGAAMRSPALSVIYKDDLFSLKKQVVRVSEITHCNPIAIDSARLVSFLIWHILNESSFLDSLNSASLEMETKEFKKLSKQLKGFMSDGSLTVKSIKTNFGNSVIATKSVPAAVLLAFKNLDNSIIELMHDCRALGGDTDTIGAISCSIWGAVNGADNIPSELKDMIEASDLIDELLKTT